MILYQSRIYRADLRANPDALYIFGDNAQRIGRGGQAAEMRGEPNAHGVATKWSPAEFYDDCRLDDIKIIIDRDLIGVARHIAQGGAVVFPLDGIGTGLSEMPARAPKAWAYLCAELAALGIAVVQP